MDTIKESSTKAKYNGKAVISEQNDIVTRWKKNNRDDFEFKNYKNNTNCFVKNNTIMVLQYISWYTIDYNHKRSSYHLQVFGFV